MISSWKRLKAAKKQRQSSEKSASEELNIPIHFRCPISLDLMKDPVTLTTGITYDRENIETWIDSGNTVCPVTKQVLKNPEPVPNHTLRKMIQDWCVENRSLGVERIPTPKFPVTSNEVSKILSRLDDARTRKDAEKCRELIQNIRTLAKESDRNKRCFVANDSIVEVLSGTFNAFSTWDKQYVALLEDILSVSILMLPHFEDNKRLNFSNSFARSLHSIVWFMRFGSLSARRYSVLVLKSILYEDRNKIDDFVNIDGALGDLMRLIKEPISPSTTKATLLIMYYMITAYDDQSQSNNKIITIVQSLIQLGIVESLLELIVSSERSTCEKALGVLDGTCSYSEGREKAYENALTVPILVKKLIRVSDLASSFSTSVLWKLAKNEKREEGGIIVEALKAGAFQKLLLLLQVGSDHEDITKKKMSELLKLLNVYRNNKVECLESLDLKDVKRPF